MDCVPSRVRRRHMRVLCAALLFIPCICHGIAESTDRSNSESRYLEFSAGAGERALFPNIFNLATHAEIRATSTCGQHGPEYYCKLVEHVFLRQPQCDVCDANDHVHQHPIDYAIDGTRRWWQSPSLGNGLAYEQVNVTIDLRQEYQVAYVILKAGISPRPGTWALEKSLDGINYQPWQYFAISDADCSRVFGKPATVGLPRLESDDEVICTSYYSKLDPLEYGEIHTSLVNGRPGSNHTSPELQAFTRTRFVRLRLLALRTLHADLMVINRRDGRLDQSVTRRYFYSISDISIGGQCICYGHAERCPPEETHGQFRCECRHNTYGESCSKCLPLYNQLPWKPGTHKHPNICQECQCFGHADSCVYDPEVEQHRSSVTPEGIYEGGGRCVDCKHNTAGINCEKCKPEFYRPANHSHYRPDACRPCDCDATGAVSNLCIRDETETYGELKAGDCICKPGFGGRRCDRCAVGYRNYPICEPCPCNRAGSLNFETCEESSCSCKANVEGEFCDRCKPGTLYLSQANPLGCQPCFCFGKTSDCVETSWTVQNMYPSEAGWNLTDLYDRVEAPLKAPVVLSEPVIFNSADYRDYNGNNELVYWKVPMGGNWLDSFGSNLHYYVYYVPSHGGPEQRPTAAVADFVIEGNSARLEYYSRLSYFPRENISVTVPLQTAANWFNARSRRPVDRADLMRVLANVENVFVRAKYHHAQVQSSIYGIRRESATSAEETESSASGVVPPVETCRCPPHFEGRSCERCESGYRRVGNQLYDGTCEKCECQGHSNVCDLFTGHCIDCEHYTAGAHCEICAPGHYGNPSLGGELGECRLCACPTVVNSHSPQCALSQLVFEGAAAAGQDAYVCTACEVGYDGNKCEICAEGFFGDPFNATIGCRPCDCTGNVDLAAIGNCDRSTGVCLRCIGNTAGDHCERCADNNWGDAGRHTCQPCNCHHRGAVASQCDRDTGACECNDGYRGAQCDRCAPGHGDADSGCPPCECDQLGATGDACDEASGQCLCKSGVYGKHCDKCIPSYFNFTADGCQFCHCDTYGAIPDKECHNVTGKCQCQPNVFGVNCERCVDGFFNITSGQGCQACECDSVGAVGETCDMTTGQCRCKPGVTGVKCNECAPNHWGLHAEGCKACQVCPAPGQVCDRVTGECVCPPNTEGSVCERCAPTAWNYDPYRGCELCACDGVGADGEQCNARTGECKCKSGYVGHKCDRCEAGFFNFPDCQPCECNLEGTEREQCRGSTCLCSNNGQCKCKNHVTGKKCDQCAANSFSLEAQNPHGCTECFCFNRTISCTQADFRWRQIYAPDRRVTFEAPFEYYTRRHNIHILRDAPPLNYNSYPTNHTPLYWPLPNTFLGDRTASYNGWIRFRIRNDANHQGTVDTRPDPNTFRLFPQVLLVGNRRIELEYVPPATAAVSLDGKYRIHLHESVWRNRISPQLPVTRKQFMVALQNVQFVFIRASYNDVYRGDSISINELSVDVASLRDDSANDGEVALGVEVCENCPEGYTGASCQNSAVGYCQKRDPDYLNVADDLALVGWSAPCACNGHSTICDPENCRCKDCEHNTAGDFCELCKPGYYGNADEGHPHVCHKCACPHAENSFSETCRNAQTGRGYICDACRPGYQGQYCESCAVGHYGNPATRDGFCAVCACHAQGSVHGVCHNVTGQCECRFGVSGRDCSQCSARHALMDGVCTSCDRGCHKELMKLEDELEYLLGAVPNIVELKPIPRKRLARISDTVASLNEILDHLKSSERDATALLSEHAVGTRFTQQASIVEQEFNLLEERNNDSSARLAALSADVDALRALVRDENNRIHVASSQLAYLAAASTDAQNDPDHLLGHAELAYNATVARGALADKNLNYAKKNAEEAKKLLEQILAKKLDDRSYRHLHERYSNVSAALRDYRNLLWDRSNADAVVAKQTAHHVNERMRALRALVGEIDALIANAQASLGTGASASEAINDTIADVQDIYEQIENSMFAELKDQRDQLNEIADRYSANNRAHEAQRHAVEIEQKAHQLKGTFDLVKSSEAFVASNAHNEIVNAIRLATNSSDVAKEKAESSQALVDKDSSESLVTLASAARNKSTSLSERLDSALNELNVAQSNRRVAQMLERLEKFDKDADRNISWIKSVQQLLDDHHDRINTIHATIDEAHAGVGDVEQRTHELVRQVNGVKERADAIHIYDHQSIQEQISNVSKSMSDFNDVQKSLEEARTRSDRHTDQITNIHQDLKVLKEKINEAREKASKIRIAVKSDVGDNCVREYISPINPTASNVITVKYRPAIDSPDSLIFLATTKSTRSQSREYIAIELKGKKLHVKWDIGGGRREAAIIKRNIVYIPASDRYTWYHIEVRRVANTIQIGVVQKRVLTGEREHNVDEPTQVHVGDVDVAGDVIFNTVPGQTRLYVGHVEDASLVEDLQLATNRFHGTVGELNVDGINVPLWVFDQTTGNCDGATGPQTQTASGHMFKNGFAQVRMPMNDRASSFISVQFSAYSPNGLLYFRGNPKNGEYVALALRDEAVVLSANYGRSQPNDDGPIKVSVRSARANYADGRVHKVRAIRNKGEVHLQIDQDDHVSTALADDNAILEVPEPDHYVAGVPTNFNRSAFDAEDFSFDNFFGCIQSVRPNQMSELDLDFPYRSQHKEAGCKYSEERLTTLDRVIGFKNETGGFVLIKGIELSSDSEKPSTFSFNFRSRRASALLLYQSSELQKASVMRRKRDSDDQTFFGVHLSNGILTAQFGIGSDIITLSSTSTYNDGLLHSVFILRHGNRIRIRVDDRELLDGTLKDDLPIGVAASRPLLVLGGVPPSVTPVHLSAVEPLVGCLSDLQYNYDRLPLALENHVAANLGSCELENGPSSSTQADGVSSADENSVSFERKKSPQLLEPAVPTLTSTSSPSTSKLSQSENLENAYSEPPEHDDSSSFPISSIGRPSHYPDTCDNTWKSDNDNMTVETAIGARFGVSESSHARINFISKPYPDFTNFKLSFSFRTEKKNAMLWTWASYKNYTRYFFLNIDHGFLMLVIKGHREPKYLHYNARRFNDNEWHSVELAKLNHEVHLQVDNHPPESIYDAPNPKVMRKRMYVGGVISKHRKLLNKKQGEGSEKTPRMMPGFVGCIRDFRLNGVAHSLTKTSRDVIACTQTRSIAYIHDGGFVTFNSLKNYENVKSVDGAGSDEAEINLQFRLKSAPAEKPSISPLIFGLFSNGDDSYQKGRILLRIINSTLFLSAHFDRYRINVEEHLNMPSILCADRWHRVSLRLGTRAVVVKLDGERTELTQFKVPAALFDEIRGLPVHIGGTTAPISAALNIRSLTGCVKNIEFSGLIVSVDSAQKLHKTVSDGCPFA